jgi:N-acetylmuramoyl-L-alanine amidase
MLAKDIPDKETSFDTTKKDANNTQYTVTEVDKGGFSIYRLTPQGISNYYYNEETEKKRVVLHYTIGTLKGDLATLCQNNQHLSVSYLIARNGKIFELFDPKYWSYHLGPGTVSGNEARSKESIGIELSNLGPLTLSGTELKDAYNQKYCDVTEIEYFTKLDSKFRDYEYFATFTSAQYQSLKSLLSYLCKEFSIPATFLPEDKIFKVFSSNSDAENHTGICSHVNYRATGKTDIGPAFNWKYLQQTYSLPVDLGSGTKVTPQAIAKYYNHVEKEFPGGYYPIGGNTVWHGGIHIRTGKDAAKVFSAMSGTVIAALLPEEDSLAIKHYGSRNFILVKHDYNGETLYAFYMHLKNIKLDENDEKA